MVLRVGNFYTNDKFYYSNLELDNKYYAQDGDLLYTWSATFGPHIWNGKKVIFHYHIWKIALSSQLDRHYVFRFLDKDRINLLSTHNGSTMIHITKSDMEQKDIYLPSLKEQIMIGNFLGEVDHLITLHQRKYILSFNISTPILKIAIYHYIGIIPKYHSCDFTRTWKQRKLGELAEETYGGGTPKTTIEEYWDGDIPWLQSSDIIEDKISGIIPHKFITIQAVQESATKLIPQNSIAIITRVGVGKISLIPFSYTTSQDFLSLSQLKVDAWYLVYALYKRLQSELHFVQGTSIKGITKQDLLMKTIFISQDKEEQRKIGDFLRNIDHLITLHQRQ